MVDAIISRISGPVAVAKDIEGAHMFDVVRIGEMGLMGEIIRLKEIPHRFKFMRIQLVSSQEKKW